jgi:YD repeat-containing protein
MWHITAMLIICATLSPVCLKAHGGGACTEPRIIENVPGRIVPYVQGPFVPAAQRGTIFGHCDTFGFPYWYERYYPLRRMRLDINLWQFADSDHIMAAGNPELDGARVVRSTDGGRTWDSVFFAPDLGMQDMSHPTPSVCVAVGDSGVIWSTSDAGATWRWTRTQWGRMLRVSMADSLHGIAGSIAGNPILRTSDGGATWDESLYIPDSIRPDKGGVTGMRAFPNGTFVVLIRWSDTLWVFRANDWGRSWSCYATKGPLIGSYDSPHSYDFVGPDTIFATGFGKYNINNTFLAYDRICSTVDGGKTWTFPLFDSLPHGWGLLAVSALDGQHVIASWWRAYFQTAPGVWMYDSTALILHVKYLSPALVMAGTQSWFDIRSQTKSPLDSLCIRCTIQPVVSGVPTPIPRSERLAVYPQPVNEEAVVQLPASIAAEARTVELFTQTGARVLTATTRDRAGMAILSTQHLPPGLYMAVVNAHDKRLACPVMVVH